MNGKHRVIVAFILIALNLTPFILERFGIGGGMFVAIHLVFYFSGLAMVVKCEMESIYSEKMLRALLLLSIVPLLLKLNFLWQCYPSSAGMPSGGMDFSYIFY